MAIQAHWTKQYHICIALSFEAVSRPETHTDSRSELKTSKKRVFMKVRIATVSAL